MLTRQEQIDQLMVHAREILSNEQYGPVLRLKRQSVDRAFEAYVFALIVEAVRSAGVAQILGRLNGKNPQVIVFRGNAGSIGSTADDFVYASCELGEEQFEIHIDIKYEGKSGACHEIDVSLITHQAAENIRRSRAGNPVVVKSAKHLLGAFECKCYGSRLGVSLGRTFVGLLADCPTVACRIFVSNSSHEGLAKYFRIKDRPDPCFPLWPEDDSSVTRFVNMVRQQLCKWAGVP